MSIRTAVLNAAVVSVFCFIPQVHAQSSEKPLAACPVKTGKKLLTVRMQVMPDGRVLDGDGDDEGTEWGQTYLSQVKPGEHAVLDCGYGAPKAAPNGAVTDHVSVPVPSPATYCWSANGAKVTGACYVKKPGS